MLEIGPSALAFTQEEVASLLMICLDEQAAELALPLYELTGGWPTAVRLALETLKAGRPQDRRAIMAGLRRPEGPLFAYLAEEVFSQEREAVREVIRLAEPFERFSPELWRRS